MTERESFEISEMKIRKCAEQHGKCGVCGKPITPYTLQLAHVIPKKKSYIKKYGKEIIHSPLNMVAVCSLKCNSAVLCDPATQPIKAQKLIDKIKESLNGNS